MASVVVDKALNSWAGQASTSLFSSLLLLIQSWGKTAIQLSSSLQHLSALRPDLTVKKAAKAGLHEPAGIKAADKHPSQPSSDNHTPSELTLVIIACHAAGLFSATQTDAVEQLARAGLRNPVRVKVAVELPAGAQQEGQGASGSSTGGASEAQRTPASLQIQYQVCSSIRKLDQLVLFLQVPLPALHEPCALLSAPHRQACACDVKLAAARATCMTTAIFACILVCYVPALCITVSA